MPRALKARWESELAISVRVMSIAPVDEGVRMKPRAPVQAPGNGRSAGPNLCPDRCLTGECYGSHECCSFRQMFRVGTLARLPNLRLGLRQSTIRRRRRL